MEQIWNSYFKVLINYGAFFKYTRLLWSTLNALIYYKHSAKKFMNLCVCSYTHIRASRKTCTQCYVYILRGRIWVSQTAFVPLYFAWDFHLAQIFAEALFNITFSEWKFWLVRDHYWKNDFLPLLCVQLCAHTDAYTYSLNPYYCKCHATWLYVHTHTHTHTHARTHTYAHIRTHTQYI